MSLHWRSNLCGCMDDCGSCCFTFFVPFGYVCIHIKTTNKFVASGYRKRTYCLACLGCCIGCALNRFRIRYEMDIAGQSGGISSFGCAVHAVLLLKNTENGISMEIKVVRIIVRLSSLYYSGGLDYSSFNLLDWASFVS